MITCDGRSLVIKRTVFLLVLIQGLNACKKDSVPDLAKQVSGSYGGTFYTSSGSGFVELTRQSSTTVNLSATLMWPYNAAMGDYKGLTLHDMGNEVYAITLRADGHNINGTIHGSTLEYDLDSQHFFKGDRQ